jgi:hypothetical protein
MIACSDPVAPGESGRRTFQAVVLAAAGDDLYASFGSVFGGD